MTLVRAPIDAMFQRKSQQRAQTVAVMSAHDKAVLEASRALEAACKSGDAAGLWTVEMTAPNVLINQGWTRDALKVGDKVTIYANPLRNDVELNDGSRGSLYVGVVLSDGKTLGRTDGQGSGSSN